MKSKLKSSVFGGLAAAGLITGVTAAFAAVSLGDTVGVNEEEIRAALTAKGYEVHEIEVEGGEVEAEVTLDGQELELVVDAKTGAVIEMELEDDDDDDDYDSESDDDEDESGHDGDDDDADDDGDDDEEDAADAGADGN